MIDAAILLAAGLGTRLAPLSSIRAKAALPVSGEVVIRRQLRWLAAAGVRRAVVNLHHLPATITSRLGHGEDLGVDVRYSWEPRVLGSAGGPRRAFDLLDADRAFVVNGDTLTDLDLHALARRHVSTGRLVTLAASPAVPAGYNALLVDAGGRWRGVRRAGEAAADDQLSGVHFVGIQVIERIALQRVSADEPSEVLGHAYPALTAEAPDSVGVWSSAATFRDVQTAADYLDTVTAVAAAEGRPLDVGAGCRVDPTATVQHSVLWDGVTIGAGAVVRDCVLADGVTIPPGRHVTRAAVVLRALAPAGVHGHADGDLWIAPLDPAG